MLNIGGWELLVIMLAALLVLGPERMPDAARQIGRAMRELRKVTTGFQRELNNAMRDPVTAASADRTPEAESDPFAGKVGTPRSAPEPEAGSEPAGGADDADGDGAELDDGADLDEPGTGIPSDR